MPSLYEISVPVFTRMLRLLDHLLGKAEASGIDERALIDARLSPDMFPLPRQIQIACDTAKLAVTRLARTEPLALPDDEATLAELRARIARTMAYIEDADPKAFAGREEAEIVLTFPNRNFTFTGQRLLTDFSLPNFYFHVTTAYALLRMEGVEIGKMDYLTGGAGPG